MFIFRDVVAAIPAILAGDATLVREELIPFFQIGTQFWSDGASTLTSSEEVRVTYSFWTAWVRHFQILPFAIVILNAISAFVLFYAFHRVGRYFYKKSLFGVFAAVLAALLIHTIMLYAKVAHFYVLIIGFSMFALSLSLLCEQVFFKTRIKKWNVAAVSLLTLLNPAIHYHVIFYVVFVMIIVMHLVFTGLMNRSFFWFYFRKSSLYFLLVTLFSLVPYVLYIYFTTSASMGDVTTQIPVNYWMIYYASLMMPFVLSLDTAGHLDLMRYGNYLAPIPRFGTMIVTLLVGSIFLFYRWRRLHIVEKVCIITLFSVLLLAMWMTIGYSPNSPFSFHQFLGGIALSFDSMGGAIGGFVSSGIATFINILRFPHRFQFIYFFIAGVLFTIVLVWLRDVLSRRMKLATATVLVVGVALFPIIASKDYRAALFSGDLASFAAPYTIPDDLKKIKTTLEKQKQTKLFILPTLESGREIVTQGKHFSFLDKFLIFYLNKPTMYYGVGANTENKIQAYLAYRSIAYDEKWWEDILINNLGVTNVVVPKNIKIRQKGIMYLAGIESKIEKALKNAKRFKQTYDGKDYALYTATDAQDRQRPILADMEWSNLSKYLNDADKKNAQLIFPIQLRKMQKAGFFVKTDSPERTFYDLYAAAHTNRIATPQPRSLPFSAEYVASSNFTNNALSLTTLYAKNDQYNYLKENVPSLVNLQKPSFVGLRRGNVDLEMTLSISKAGRYRLLLHAASKRDIVDTSLGSMRVELRKVSEDRGKGRQGDYMDFSYYWADVNIEAGKHSIRIKNTNTNAVLIDSVLLVPSGDIPKKFDDVGKSGVAIKRITPDLLIASFAREQGR